MSDTYKDSYGRDPRDDAAPWRRRLDVWDARAWAEVFVDAEDAIRQAAEQAANHSKGD